MWIFIKKLVSVSFVLKIKVSLNFSYLSIMFYCSYVLTTYYKQTKLSKIWINKYKLKINRYKRTKFIIKRSNISYSVFWKKTCCT